MKIFNILKKKTRRQRGGQELLRMVEGVEALSDTLAKEVMVPRVDVVAIDVDSSPATLFNEVANSVHSRFPVYHDTIDNIVGILYVKDLLKISQEDINSIDISTIIKQPFFVPEAMYLNVLLREMQKKHMHITVVVDEYGGVSGIVCLEDIIEEIVGEIQDEFDNEEEEFVQIGNDIYLIDARLPISKFNEFLSLTLPEEDYDTMGGYVYDLFGKIPVRYEKISDNNIDYIIQIMDGNKIRSIKVIVHANGKK